MNEKAFQIDDEDSRRIEFEAPAIGGTTTGAAARRGDELRGDAGVLFIVGARNPSSCDLGRAAHGLQ
jgi:hypothetical protein